jgi:hypothetical protein
MTAGDGDHGPADAVRHVVLFQFGDSTEPELWEITTRMQGALGGLIGVVPGLVDVQVGRGLFDRPNHWPVAAITTHTNVAALEAYRAHPAHRAEAAWIEELASDRAIIDFVPGGTA